MVAAPSSRSARPSASRGSAHSLTSARTGRSATSTRCAGPTVEPLHRLAERRSAGPRRGTTRPSACADPTAAADPTATARPATPRSSTGSVSTGSAHRARAWPSGKTSSSVQCVKVGEALVEQLGERAQLLARGEGPFGTDRKLHIGQDAERAQPDAGRIEVRPVDPVQLAVAVDQPHRLDQRGERADRGAAAMSTGADRPSDGDAVATGNDVDRQAVPRQLCQQVVQLLAGPHPHPVRVERDDAGERGRVERDVVRHRQWAP